MSQRTKDILLLSIIIAATYVLVCVYDLVFGLLITGFTSNIFNMLSNIFYAKPFRFIDIAVVFFVAWLIGGAVIVLRHWLKEQERQARLKDLSREDLKRAIQTQYQKRFWTSFALFTVATLLVLLAFIVLKDSNIWYAYDPWFSLLYVLKTVFPYVLATAWIVGVIVILFNQWRHSAADIVGLVDSIEQMQEGQYGDAIIVPKDLTQLQPVLQGMFDASCRDKAAAEEAEKRKKDLILYLAHDLKTPLTSVLGYLSLLTENVGLSEEQKAEYLHIAKDKALRLESLTNQFFEISRFNLHEVTLEQSSFDLKLLLTQLGDEFYPLLQDQEKSIVIDADDTLEIYGDASMLARVFDNILRNALSYSSPTSIIELAAHKTEWGVLVSITNTGTTIPKEQLAAVFEKFYRLDESRTSGTGGAGLGLAIAAEIVHKHQGTIQASSAEGVTTFTVMLPQVQ